MKKILHSKILQYFNQDLMIALNHILYMDANNEVRGNAALIELQKYGFKYLPLGSGTNRIGVQIDDTVFKIALDNHGKIDNKREFKYTDKLQPYVIRCYECFPDGHIMACEPFIPISMAEFEAHKDEIIEILKDISKNFFIGDIGFTGDNFKNWGRRKTDGKFGILDFAYIYSTSYQTFRCTCDARDFLRYDKNYVNLICPTCGKSFSFGTIRKRISRKAEADEIGNIEEISYVLHKPTEIVDENKNYTISLYNEPNDKSKKIEEKKRMRERNRKINLRLDGKIHFDEFEVDDPKSFDEIMSRLNEDIKRKAQ